MTGCGEERVGPKNSGDDTFGYRREGERLLMTLWEDLTMPGLESLRQQTQTVILPVGSLEEHGAHLPLGTDTFHALEVARRAAKLRPVVVAPPLFYGMCRSTSEHPGTVSISGDALRAMLLSVGAKGGPAPRQGQIASGPVASTRRPMKTRSSRSVMPRSRAE